MKSQIISLFLLLPLFIWAELDVHRVNQALLGLKSSKPLKFFNDNPLFVNKLERTKSSVMFTTLKEADILLFPKLKKSNKMMIAKSYSELKKNKKNIGAIYIKKGRTHIVFIEERLKNRGLKLSATLNKYLIKESYLNPLCFIN